VALVSCIVEVVVAVVVKFFNKNFVRRKVDSANIQTETDIKQSKQVQLHNTNIQNSDTTIKTKQAKFSPGDIGINIYILVYVDALRNCFVYFVITPVTLFHLDCDNYFYFN